jgi:glycosyltransferase involved in cell wall biosynthesis
MLAMEKPRTKNQEHLVSIVVANYNNEKYLDKCLSSIISQKYKNIEIVIVDDGSTDHSRRIIEKYSNEDKRIKTVFKSNGGLSDARNKGLKQCDGTYITFADSDDFFSDNWISTLVNGFTKSSIGMTICNFYHTKDDGRLIGVNPKKVIKGNFPNSDVQYDILVGGARGYVWNKMFLASVIKDNSLEFTINAGKREDLEWCERYLTFVDEVEVSNSPEIFYRQNPNSALHTIGMENFQSIASRKRIIQLTKQKRIEDKLTGYNAIYLIKLARKAKNTNLQVFEEAKRNWYLYKKISFKAFTGLGYKQKILYISAIISFDLAINLGEG